MGAQMNEPKYQILLNILDEIRINAPNKKEYKRFRSKKNEDINYSRGQAFIHLYLQIKFGVESFEDCQSFICDGQNDGGVDSYYISEANKTVYLIQSKFKNSSKNFSSEEIRIKDLVKMELDRIIGGETTDSNGVNYNPKIHEFQLKLNQASQKQIYKHKVIFLANISRINDYQLRKFTSNLDYEIYDFERCYFELVKPMCSGTNYNPEKIVIELDLSEKSTPQLSQSIDSSYGYCDVSAVFVPTFEIGKVMSRYKNAILQYNPRNYLGLSKNQVNKEIRNSIVSLKTNDFALLNNGITILADEQEISLTTGKKNVGRLTLTNPQIINGGQTAYTLSEIYEKDYIKDPTIFSGKEVLVRIVVLKKQNSRLIEKRHQFIEAISTSTNQQTVIKPADRNSSNPVLQEIQNMIFKNYGFLLELKQGEFYNGKDKGYLQKAIVINRILILRSYLASLGFPTAARRHSERQLFEEYKNHNHLNKSYIKKGLAAEMFFSFKIHNYLSQLGRKIGSKSLIYGYSLRYGKYAVVYATTLLLQDTFKNNLPNISLESIDDYLDKTIISILKKWKNFEKNIQRKKSNRSYFNPKENLNDFDTYYKGTTLKKDIEDFFT